MTPTEAPREALPDLDPKRMLGYDAIRYVAGYPESYVKEYAASLLESERQAHAAEVEGLRVKAARYDWLRHGDNDEKVLMVYDTTASRPFDSRYDAAWLPRKEHLDAAIDQAIARGTK